MYMAKQAPKKIDSSIADKKLPSAYSLVKPSIQALRVNSGTIIGLLFSPLIAVIPFSIILLAVGTSLQKTANVTHVESTGLFFSIMLVILYVAIIAFFILCSEALLFATLQSVRGNKTTYSLALQAAAHNFGNYIGLMATMLILSVLGLVCLVIPGLFIIKRYYLAPFYMIDHNRGIAEALNQSQEDTKKYGGIWGLMGLWFVIVVLFFIPAVGWLFTFAGTIIFCCATALRYEQIQALNATAKPGRKTAARRRTAAA